MSCLSSCANWLNWSPLPFFWRPTEKGSKLVVQECRTPEVSFPGCWEPREPGAYGSTADLWGGGESRERVHLFHRWLHGLRRPSGRAHLFPWVLSWFSDSLWRFVMIAELFGACLFLNDIHAPPIPLVVWVKFWIIVLHMFFIICILKKCVFICHMWPSASSLEIIEMVIDEISVTLTALPKSVLVSPFCVSFYVSKDWSEYCS